MPRNDDWWKDEKKYGYGAGKAEDGRAQTTTSVATGSSFNCHKTHPPYPVTDTLVVYGGSGIRPHHEGLDIYVSVDAGRKRGPKQYPWHEGEDLVFPITNYMAPDDPVEFRALIEWLALQLEIGRSVHVGCMAGHGRTGIVLAALRMKMTGDRDAIKHVRENYCSKAVETPEQVAWLVKHWGVNTIGARYGATGATKKSSLQKDWLNNPSVDGSVKLSIAEPDPIEDKHFYTPADRIAGYDNADDEAQHWTPRNSRPDDEWGTDEFWDPDIEER